MIISPSTSILANNSTWTNPHLPFNSKASNYYHIRIIKLHLLHTIDHYLIFQNVIADENQLLSGAESQQAEVRVAFGESGQSNPETQAASNDQQTAAQTNSATIDEISLDDADDTEENRNKR